MKNTRVGIVLTQSCIDAFQVILKSMQEASPHTLVSSGDAWRTIINAGMRHLGGTQEARVPTQVSTQAHVPPTTLSPPSNVIVLPLSNPSPSPEPEVHSYKVHPSMEWFVARGGSISGETEEDRDARWERARVEAMTEEEQTAYAIEMAKKLTSDPEYMRKFRTEEK